MGKEFKDLTHRLVKNKARTAAAAQDLTQTWRREVFDSRDEERLLGRGEQHQQSDGASRDVVGQLAPEVESSEGGVIEDVGSGGHQTTARPGSNPDHDIFSQTRLSSYEFRT